MAFDYEREEMPDGELNVTLKLFDADNRVEGVAYNYFDRDIGYEYDPYGRLITRAHRMAPGYGSLDRDGGPYDGCYLTNYFYQNVGDYDTTPLVTEVYQPGNWFEYTYDNVGNIASENRNNFLTTYGYDALGQLTRVNDEWEEYTWTYAYDRGGNIVSKAKYYYTEGAPGTPVETVAYTYGDANWKDKLTAYDGKAITYDAIGNPLTYDGWTYTWKAGRMLHSLVKSGTNAQFAYDHNGQRVKKTVNGVVTEYTLMGKDIVHLKKGADELHFYYDAQGKPGMIRYNGEYYYYLYNLQGDVIAIIDDYANAVAEYYYDAWGKQTGCYGVMSQTLGKLNPFRYRGYVYDEETGLYYLRSRYYNPEWGRFVNADSTMDYSRILSNNLYAYCKNSPVRSCDLDGYTPAHDAYLFYYNWANADGPALFGDAIGLLGAAFILIASSLSKQDTATVALAKSKAAEKEKEEEKSKFIYRLGSGSNRNLTPRAKDTTGLSFTTIKPVSGKYVTTTMEAINSTGVLMAVQDSPTHVSVFPVNIMTMPSWIASRDNADILPHPYTLLLKMLTK